MPNLTLTQLILVALVLLALIAGVVVGFHTGYREGAAALRKAILERIEKETTNTVAP